MSASAASDVLRLLGPSCRDDARRQLLLARAALNGIDHVEFRVVAGEPVVFVHFLLDLPAGAYGLPVDPSPIKVQGGTRIVPVRVVRARIGIDARVLEVTVDQQGDFSPYLLTIGWSGGPPASWAWAFDGLDRLFSVAPVNFRPGCPVDFDCAPPDSCPPDTLPEPALDYLARDYASFRQLLVDLVAQNTPAWTERAPADVGMALLELFAYEGDHLAYLQDAVANEPYLDTARQRESVKRHAGLVDYRMHDGRNAWTYVHLAVDGHGEIPAGVQLVTRIAEPLRFDRVPGATPPPQPVAPPGTQLHPLSGVDAAGERFDDHATDPALGHVRVFETAMAERVHSACNELRLHTWGNERCCLPRGSTSAHVYAVDPATTAAIRPPLRVGDHLLLEEVRGPDSGSPADADPDHRQVVLVERLVPDPTDPADPQADLMHDQLFRAALDPGSMEPRPADGPLPVAQTLPLLEVTWRAADALTFPLSLSAQLADGTTVSRVSLARGNIALADHGRTVTEDHRFDPPHGGERARLRLHQSPLTMRCRAPEMSCDVRQAAPAIDLVVQRSAGTSERWRPVVDLLSSGELDADFVADVDGSGRAVLRFGDGEYGRRLLDAARITATYRIGVGRAGNIGAEALAHIVVPSPLPAGWPPTLVITRVRNPLPARDGVDPESLEEVRQGAPAAFRSTQFRAVTEEDYSAAASTVPGVAGAVASFRWTGSWHTVLVAVDPADPGQLWTDARGATRLAPALRDGVLDVLDRYRLAGYDLEVRAATYVPLDLALHICVEPGFFRGDVARAVEVVLTGVRPGDGTGLFDPGKLTFGQPVHLSRVYAAATGVEGVESALVTAFHRHGRSPAGELERGVLPVGAWEIARLDNDPNRRESGTLTITAAGGS
ncbi:putative baseplate assembly protein [Geodermatophilus sp. URMC 62]|uniref:putative baseplate assembly protein n=1 Tax=Geodermatophilus sp. URMC 62 TaxID=3423414 RepID=UPI00406C6A7D